MNLVPALAAVILVFAAPAPALADTSSGAPCTPDLTVSASWDTPEEGSVLLNPQVAWRPCSGSVRRVSLRVYAMDDTGAITAQRSAGFRSRDVTRQTSPAQQWALALDSSSPQAVTDFLDADALTDPAPALLASCTDSHAGESFTEAYTFYVLATAYDRTGRELTDVISPEFRCPQQVVYPSPKG